MNQFIDVERGLWNLDLAARRRVYGDLRLSLGFSETEPMVPLPREELEAWSHRFAALLAQALLQHETTRALADSAVIYQNVLGYGEPATDAVLEQQVKLGRELKASGLPGLYLATWLNAMSLHCSSQAAREVLTPASALVVEQRYPIAMLLRHALIQEVQLGTAGASLSP